MRDHALIGKFVGFWPTEKALRNWINIKWRPKGQITLLLGPKGFFTAIFNCLEDRNRVFDGGPYFFNSAGLFLREWVGCFNPNKEDLSYALVWIRLYSLPWEYWEEESLKAIGSVLGDFVKVAEETKTIRYTSYASYARICVYMDLKQRLPDTVCLFHEDQDWIQVIDYEHVPFRCRKCHALGHLFKDCPLNNKATAQNSQEKQSQDGFTKVTNRRRGSKKSTAPPKTAPEDLSKPSTSKQQFRVNPRSDRGSAKESGTGPKKTTIMDPPQGEGGAVPPPGENQQGPEVNPIEEQVKNDRTTEETQNTKEDQA
eukprot:PITA_17744